MNSLLAVVRVLFIVLVFLVCVICDVFARSADNQEGRVPRAWYSLPEDGGGDEELVFSTGDRLLKTNLLRIFSAQRQALVSSGVDLAAEGLSDPGFLKSPVKNDRPADWVPWRLAAFASDLAVSAGGQVGVLAFKGTPSVSVIWRKREKAHLDRAQAPKKTGGIESLGTRTVFRMSESLRGVELDEQIESIYRMAKASGKVRKTKRLRTEISQAVQKFREMGSAVSASPFSSQWYPSHLRMDLEITVEGRVKWGTVGGAVGLRLEWERLISTKSNSKQLKFSEKQEGLLDLVGAIAVDLEATQRAWTPANPRFAPTLLVVALAINAQGTIGVARASGSVAGMVYFSRTPQDFLPRLASASSPSARFAKASWWLIDDKSEPRAFAFARAGGIESIRTKNGASYRVARERFRQGLKKAFQIGDYFAARAAESASDDWAISEIRPGFTMSVGGGLGLATLTGSATAVLILQDTKF